MKKPVIPFAVLILSLMAALVYFEFFRGQGIAGGEYDGTGTIEVTEIELSSMIAGRVVSVEKEEGETVAKGDLVAKIDYDELDAQRLSATASLANARSNLKRVKKLYESGSTSRKEYDAVRTAYRVARANYDRIMASIRNARLFSPIQGVVLHRNLEPGEMAFPGTAVCTIADLSRPWINIYVRADRLGHIKLGQKAVAMVDSFEDREFSGRVTAISNKAEFTPRTIETRDERVKLMFAVKVSLQNKDSALKPGMPADVKLVTEKEEQ